MKRGIFLVVLIGALGTLALWGLRGIPERAAVPAGAAASAEPEAPAGVELDSRAAAATPERARAGVDAALGQAAPAAAGDAVESGGAPPHVTVHGRLVDEHGGIVAGPRASVAARDERGVGRDAERLDGGRFELHALPPGRWWIEADAHGFEPAQMEVFLPSESVTRELDLVLRSLPVVRVILLTPSGEAFARARQKDLFLPRVLATREPLDGALLLDLAQRTPCGSLASPEEAELDERHLGLLELACAPPVWVSLVLAGRVLAAQRVEPGVAEVVFVLDPAEHARLFSDVRLRVVDLATGEPVQGAIARFTARPFHSWLNITDESGGLEYEGVISGPASLSLSRGGYAPRVLEFEVPSGETLDLGDVAMDSSARGRLRLSIAAPQGVSTVSVSWAHAAEGPQTSWSTGTWKAGDVVELELGPGRWIVWAEAAAGERGFGSRDVEVAIDGGIAQERLSLEPLARLVLEPATGARNVTILDPEVRSSSRRTYLVEERLLGIDLVPGSYELVVRGREGEERRMPLDLPPAGASVKLE